VIVRHRPRSDCYDKLDDSQTFLGSARSVMDNTSWTGCNTSNCMLQPRYVEVSKTDHSLAMMSTACRLDYPRSYVSDEQNRLESGHPMGMRYPPSVLHASVIVESPLAFSGFTH